RFQQQSVRLNSTARLLLGPPPPPPLSACSPGDPEAAARLPFVLFWLRETGGGPPGPRHRRAGRRASAAEILRRNFGDLRSPCLRAHTGGRMQCGTEGTPDGSVSAKEHIYCTVYCIANDGHLSEAQIPDRRDEAVTSDAAEMDSSSGRGAGSSPEPTLYTVDDLVDPFGDLSYRLYSELSGTDAAVRSCRVCLEETAIASLSCCRKAVCDGCLKLYVSSQVGGRLGESCPIPECNGNLEEGVVIAHLAKENVAKYQYFLELSQLDSSTKPCPHCSHFTSLKAHNPNRSEHKYKIQCSNCQFVWCFKCHAPWHNGIKCRDYRKGDKLLRTWASVIEDGQRNAQKCPQCKIHIQRTEGCDHMTCAQCNTNFCYRCGERYRHLRFFGDHTSNLSVFGCKYRYLPDKPHLRRLVRGSVCGKIALTLNSVVLQ
uniref:RBR-type E3 ubiquitin transferase n=1 Tax=Salarias fasciatus TaxID=181472 RepID=A0A672H4J6_SALFA